MSALASHRGHHAIAVTGLGAVTAVGRDVSALRAAIVTGRTAMGPLTRFEGGGFPVCEVGEVPGDRSQGTVTHRLAIAAALEAVRASGVDIAAQRERVAVICGTTTGGIAFSEVWFLHKLAGLKADPNALRHHPAGSVTDGVAQALGAGGPRLTISTACSSGANAILMGADLLRAGECDVAVCGGADALTLMTYYGFRSLKLMSPVPCTPFGRDRHGLSLGEAGAFVVLERGDAARARGRAPHAWLTGGACTCDAFHMTTPAQDGQRVAAAIRQALGELDPAAIGYVNAHGTGTAANDITEARALRSVLGPQLPPVSSTKSWHGHTLGAAGALEAIITVIAVEDGVLPATLNTTLADDEAPRDRVSEPGRRAEIAHALSTAFAFGGNNTALRFSREAS